MRVKKYYRYQALTNNGTVIAVGDRLRDVEKMGERIIVDFKLRRWTRQGVYPATRYTWRQGLRQVGDVLRRGKGEESAPSENSMVKSTRSETPAGMRYGSVMPSR